MKNKDRDHRHRRRREAGERDETPDARAVAEALYGGDPSALGEDEEDDPEPTLFTDEPDDMPHPSKRKANRHEREIVNRAEDAGLFAERAYASNGQSLGETEETDVVLQAPGRHVRIQAKRRKTVANYLTTDGADVVVTREDHGQNLAVVPLDLFFDLLRDAKRQHG